MLIDFKEIPRANTGGGLQDTFELFSRDFLEDNDFFIVSQPSRGADGKQDMIVSKTSVKWLVSCKHYAHSGSAVSDTEEPDIIDRLNHHKCHGFIGVYSTLAATSLHNKLQGYSDRIAYIIYDREQIEKLLIKKESGVQLIQRYFPASYVKWTERHESEKIVFKTLTVKDFQSKENNYYKKYYEGQPCDWSLIRKYTFKRQLFNSIISQLDENKLCLITGAGGEGKTTLLMQVGEYYFTRKYEVHYCFGSIKNLHSTDISFISGKQCLLIIDNANEIENIYDFIKAIKLSFNVEIKALLASRKNEWLHAMSKNINRKEITQFIGKELTLQKLSKSELNLLVNLLKKHNEFNDEISNKLLDFIDQNKESNFLLSVMIFATQGKSFDAIIIDVVNKILDYDINQLTINAIGYIVCIELLGHGLHGVLYCKEDMLRELIGINGNVQYFKIKEHLAEEAFFQGALKNQINTRNPLIAKLYFQYLFNPDLPILDKYAFYYRIMASAVTSNSIYGRDLLAIIPKYFYDKDKALAIQLLKDAVSFGFFWNTYYEFINDEIENENVGSYDSDAYSARWLFKQAFSKNPNDKNLYAQWGKFEFKQTGIGDIATEYSCRWIFTNAIKIAPAAETFLAWANLELAISDVATNDQVQNAVRALLELGISEEPSAALFLALAKLEWKEKDSNRAIEIIKKGIDETSSPELFSIWAKYEAEKGNIDGAIEILKRGIDKTPVAGLFSTWAKYEAEKGNIEVSIEILKKGIDKTPSADLFSIWAKYEAEKGNIEVSIEILKKGIDKTPVAGLFSTWAKHEAEKGNIEAAIEILKKGIDKAPAPYLFSTWAKYEAEKGNIDTAIDIIKKGIAKFPNSDLFSKWAKYEAEKGNFDSARDIVNTNKFTKTHTRVILSALIELKANNTGQINQRNTARWLLAENWKTYNMEPSYCGFWLFIEIMYNNIGSLAIPYSGEWLFAHSKRIGMDISKIHYKIFNGKKTETINDLRKALIDIDYARLIDIDISDPSTEIE